MMRSRKLKTLTEAVDENEKIMNARYAESTATVNRRKGEQIKKMRIQGNYKLGNMLLRDITSTDIALLGVRLIEKYKAKTVNSYFTIFRAVFKRALSDGIIERDPMINIENYKVDDPDPDPFSKNEIALLIAPSQDQDQEIALITLGMATGLRISELMALSREDFDVSRGILSVTLALVCGKFKCTKTDGSDRKINLNQVSLNSLKILLETTECHPPRTLNVTLRDNKTKVKKKRTLLAYCASESRLYKSVDDFRESFFAGQCSSRSVRYRGPSQLRHTFVSQMLTAGLPLQWIASQLGHTSIKMVERIYGKWIDEDSSDTQSHANESMNNVFGIERGADVPIDVESEAQGSDIDTSSLQELSSEVLQSISLSEEYAADISSNPVGAWVDGAVISSCAHWDVSP